MAGEKSVEVVLELASSSTITAVDIGNEHSAFVEVWVAKNGAPEFQVSIGRLFTDSDHTINFFLFMFLLTTANSTNLFIHVTRGKSQFRSSESSSMLR